MLSLVLIIHDSKQAMNHCRLMAQADYSRPNRVGYCSTTGGQVGGSGIGGSQGGGGQGSGSQGGNPSGAPVKVSFALPGSSFDNSQQSVEDRIAFNFGREIFVYPYKGEIISYEYLLIELASRRKCQFLYRSKKGCRFDEALGQASVQGNMSYLS